MPFTFYFLVPHSKYGYLPKLYCYDVQKFVCTLIDPYPLLDPENSSTLISSTFYGILTIWDIPCSFFKHVNIFSVIFRNSPGQLSNRRKIPVAQLRTQGCNQQYFAAWSSQWNVYIKAYYFSYIPILLAVTKGSYISSVKFLLKLKTAFSCRKRI